MNFVPPSRCIGYHTLLYMLVCKDMYIIIFLRFLRVVGMCIVGLVVLNIVKNLNVLNFEVIDNGCGFSATSKDGKTHAIDVFKKRLELEGKKEETSFRILSNSNGTTINFSLKI